MKTVRITNDFETQSRAELKKVGAYEYSKDPSTRPMCYAIKASDSHQVWFLDFYQSQTHFSKLPIKLQIQWRTWIIDPEYVFEAHNAFFEQCIYNNVMVAKYGWPKIPLTKWRCSAVRAAAVAIPRNLDGAGQVMRLKVQKDYEGHRVMMKLCKPTRAFSEWKKKYDKFLTLGLTAQAEAWEAEKPFEFWTPETAPEDFQILYKYCVKDVRTEEHLSEALPELTPFEQNLWFYDQKINQRGIAVDMAVVNKIMSIMAIESKTMNKELDSLTMGLVSSGNARNQILEFLQFEGIELPDLKAKTVDDFLANGKVTGDAKKLLEIRRALSKASTAKYLKFKLCSASDGRARDLFLMNAASTGRWGGKNIQPQNMPRGIIKDIDLAIENIKTYSTEILKLIYGENLMPLFSSVLRGMFIASPGHELFVEDWNAIETRVLWWIADHEDGLNIFREGRDPYREMAAAIFKKSMLDITDEERQVGKAAVLGCGYQMGWKKFIAAAWDVYRAKVDKDLAKLAVSIYRELHYKVTELWDFCNDAAIEAVESPGKVIVVNGLLKFFVENSFLWIELPSGRRLAYKDPSVEMSKVVVMFNAETDERIYAQNAAMFKEARENGFIYEKEFEARKLRFWAVNHKAKKEDCVIPKWTKEATYGGKLVENIVQAVSRDLLAFSIVNAEKSGFSVLMHSHDELVCEAPLGAKTHDDYKKVMARQPVWAKGLPLKTSGWTGLRYKKG